MPERTREQEDEILLYSKLFLEQELLAIKGQDASAMEKHTQWVDQCKLMLIHPVEMQKHLQLLAAAEAIRAMRSIALRPSRDDTPPHGADDYLVK